MDFCYFCISNAFSVMKKSKIVGIVILALVWLWLGWGILAASGVTLYNLLIVAMAGLIIFIPLLKKRNEQ